jgi:uncharacterized protein (TIGR03067 family)
MFATRFPSVMLTLSFVVLPASAAPEAKEDLAKLQGSWSISTLEVDGVPLKDAALLTDARIVIDGDKFTNTSMGATYTGTLKLDPAATPPSIDMTFTDGPEKGKTALGIYKLKKDGWTLCLAITAKERPREFATNAASGSVLETLKSDPSAALQGEWTAVSGEMDGNPLPEAYVKNGHRIVKASEVTVRFGEYIFMKAVFTVDATKSPNHIDYTIAEGPEKGKVRQGIYEIDGNTFKSCMSPPGKPRPTTFEGKAGDGQTFSVWKKQKKAE